MAALSIRDLDDGVRDRLRVRAARNGRSTEAEGTGVDVVDPWTTGDRRGHGAATVHR